MEEKVLEIYVIRHEGAEPTELPEDIGIIIERVEVPQDLRDVASGSAVLLGLIYSLNLSYPKDRRYMFEFLQKVLVSSKTDYMSNPACSTQLTEVTIKFKTEQTVLALVVLVLLVLLERSRSSLKYNTHLPFLSFENSFDLMCNIKF